MIIAPIQYDRWLSPLDPDPRDLLVPFPSEPMTIWPISTRVNKPENDDPTILEPMDDSLAPPTSINPNAGSKLRARQR